ncbi:hypothetical protein HK102_007393, partial [Quaeritorhiza haematococci]
MTASGTPTSAAAPPRVPQLQRPTTFCSILGTQASKCGYCRSSHSQPQTSNNTSTPTSSSPPHQPTVQNPQEDPETSISFGLWCYDLSPHDYQRLLDLGWRRSGKYIYKPDLHRTC